MEREPGTPPRRLERREKAALFGRRPFANKKARELLNDASEQILRTEPDWVDDPADPTLSDVLQFELSPSESKVPLLSDLLSQGLTFQEAVVWYMWRYCQMTPRDIHYATKPYDKGGDVGELSGASRNIRRVLGTAAGKLGEDIPDDLDVDDSDDSGVE